MTNPADRSNAEYRFKDHGGRKREEDIQIAGQVMTSHLITSVGSIHSLLPDLQDKTCTAQDVSEPQLPVALFSGASIMDTSVARRPWYFVHDFQQPTEIHLLMQYP